MAKAIIRFIRGIVFDRCVFDLGPGEFRQIPRSKALPSTREAWMQDWKNLSEDFKCAARRVISEA